MMPDLGVPELDFHGSDASRVESEGFSKNISVLRDGKAESLYESNPRRGSFIGTASYKHTLDMKLRSSRA